MRVNTIPAKIRSLYEIIREQTLNKAKWSDLVVGKHKKFAYGRQENTSDSCHKKSP